MILKKIFDFYVDGFRNMSKSSVKLWIIIAIKLFIMFAILKVFFFKNYLGERYSTEDQKSEHVIEQLIINKN